MELSLPAPNAPPPNRVREIIAAAEARARAFGKDLSAPAFGACDFAGVYAALHAIATGHLAAGNRFCEWGSGLGAVACLAAELGFEAGGIEIEPRLVGFARELAAEFGLVVEFIHGSFVPEDSAACLDAGEPFAWLSTRHGHAAEDFGFDPPNVDLFFCYPWTDEETLIPSLIERHAGVGALLLSFHGSDGFRLRRKVAAGSASRRRKPTQVHAARPKPCS